MTSLSDSLYILDLLLYDYMTLNEHHRIEDSNRIAIDNDFDNETKAIKG